MQRDWTYARALEELWRRSSYERGLISDPFGDAARAERGLERMRSLLAALGEPQRQVPSVHVAGSKGKGSTCAFIAAVAREAGHRVGLYTSPHLHRFPERVAIDGRPLSDEEFAFEAGVVAEAAERIEAQYPELGQVSTFELVTAMGFAAFARRGCDVAVIEVGLGGRYDATNVIQPIVSVITRIDLEHTAVLGPTHADIAAQKAGIMKPGVPCVASPQISSVEEVLAAAAAEIGVPLLMGGGDWTWRGSWRSFDASGPRGMFQHLRVGVPGEHQVENACSALAALHFVDRAGLAIPEAAARRGLAETRWPGRFELVQAGERDVVLDGAHTAAAASALVETWREHFPDVAATVIFGTGSDKDAQAVLSALRPITGQLIATRAASPRAAEPAGIVAIASELDITASELPTVEAALAAGLSMATTPLLVTGSLFVVGEARETFGLASPDDAWHELNRKYGAVTAGIAQVQMPPKLG